MKKQLFYIHGGSAYADYERYLNHLRTTEIKDPTQTTERPKRWTDSLREDLGEEYEIFTPTMPNKYNAKYLEWQIWFERHFPYLRDDLILLGWSQGGMFLVKYLLENDLPVRPKALLLAAAPYEAVEWEGEDGGDFLFDPAKLPELATKVPAIHIFHSKDDFVVPFAHAHQFKAALPDATLHTFTDKNHFLIEEFPELIDLITSLD